MREAELLARDRWSLEELLAFQRERVRALIRHAVTHSPYYRESLGADAADRSLAELPTLPKATMMAEFDRVVTDPRLRLAQLQAHLAGPDPSQSFSARFEWRPARAQPVDGRSLHLQTTKPRRGGRRALGP
jgi:hypothetical protein